MSALRDDAIAAYCAELLDLEDEVEAAQEDKKKFFENARDAHGRKFVAALKLAIKTARLDPDKRIQVEEIDAEAERILGIMRQGLHVARGARTREDVPEHDAETGEIIEPQPLAAQTVPAQPVAKSPAEGDAVETSASIPDAADALPVAATEPPRPVVASHTPEMATSGEAEEAADGESPSTQGSADAVPNGGGDHADGASESGAPIPEPLAAAEGSRSTRGTDVGGSEGAPAGEAVATAVASPVSKVVFFHEDADPLCQDPDTCGSWSRLAVCEGCKQIARDADHGDEAVRA